MATRDDIVRSCIDMAAAKVPFVHNGRSRAGLDCGGLILLSLWENGVPAPDWPKPYIRMVHKQHILINACRCHLDAIPIADADHGDLLMMWWNRHTKEPQHLAILNGPDRIVHAYTGSSTVVHVHLSPKYRRRITHAFRFPTEYVRR